MGQALYRKYRSKSLSEIIGQEYITTALQNALKQGRLSHAYLFTGPRGTGKTSIARILAHEINGLPYSTDPHLDIIEIDAASNRRIDEIRDLRDKVYIAPTSAKYKVYIIDEVHMLTREAFNALLKTLEEPPAHVVFILATTDAHKLPETIISRTQRYTFRPVALPKVAKHLAFIAKTEDIQVDPEALELLAAHGEGSFRDSISMLDQVSNTGDRVTAEAVRQQLGIPSAEALGALADSLGEAASPLVQLESLYDQGYRAAAIAEQLSQLLRQQLVAGTADASTLELLKQLLEVAPAHDPERLLEIILLQQAAPTLPTKQPATIVAPAAAGKATAKPTEAAAPVAKESAKPAPQPSSAAPKKARKAVAGAALTDEDWNLVLAELKKEYNTIYGIVRMAHTDFSEPGKLGLTFAFAFHQKRISDPKNRKILTETIEAVTGQAIDIHCILSKEPQPRPSVTPLVTEISTVNPLDDISSVFGGGELL